MELLADENLDRRIVAALRQAGYPIFSVYEEHRGISDPEVIELANEQNCVIVTEDKDFGELTYRLEIPNKGIVLIRLSGLAIQDKVDTILQVFEQFGGELYGSFTVVKADRVRIRKLIQE